MKSVNSRTILTLGFIYEEEGIMILMFIRSIRYTLVMALLLSIGCTTTVDTIRPVSHQDGYFCISPPKGALG